MHKVRSFALNAVGPVSLIQLDERLREGAEGREVEDTALRPCSSLPSCCSLRWELAGLP